MEAARRVLRGYNGAQLRTMLESSSRDKGAGHQDTIHIAAVLVDWLMERKQLQEAIPLARRVKTYYERLGPEAPHDDLLRSMVMLAILLEGSGHYDEAEGLYIKALDSMQRELGPEHPKTIECCDRLAGFWTFSDQHDKAEPLHRRVVDFNTRLLGLQHPQTIEGIVNLGLCLAQPGKAPTACPAQADKEKEGVGLLRQALELNMRVRGLQHPETAYSMLSLSNALAKIGDNKQAESMLRQGLQISNRIDGEFHHTSLNCILDLGRLLCTMGKFTEALPVCRHGLELHQRVYGEGETGTVHLMLALAEALRGVGERDEAEVMATRTLWGCTRVLGDDHPTTQRAAGLVQVLAPAGAAAQQGAAGRGRRGRGGGSGAAGRGSSSSGAGARGGSSGAGRGTAGKARR